MKRVQFLASDISCAYSQQAGKDHVLQDVVLQYNNECIIVADGLSALPHGDFAALFAAETALWGYKYIRQRPFYWADKVKLLKRIFRSTNIALWQKRKERLYRDGIASTLCVLIIGTQKWWVGSLGDSRVYFIREGLIEEKVAPEDDVHASAPITLGSTRSLVIPRTGSDSFLSGDMIVVATDGAADVLCEEDVRNVYEESKKSPDPAQFAAHALIGKAISRNGVGDKTVCVILHTGEHN